MATNNTLIYPDAVQVISIEVNKTVEAGEPYFGYGLHGVVMQDAESGVEVAFDISHRTWQMNVGDLSVGQGDSLYIDTTTGDLTVDNSDRWFGVVLTEKDDNDVVDVLIAPQTDDNAA